MAAALRAVPFWVEKWFLTDAVFDIVSDVPVEVRGQLHMFKLLRSLFSSVCSFGDHSFLLKALSLHMVREGDHANFVKHLESRYKVVCRHLLVAF